MAIEIIILKVSHEKESEARKLLPFIQKCDVYGFEMALATERDASEQERKWEQEVLNAGLNRTSAQRKVEELFRHQSSNEDEWAFNRRLYDDLFRQRKHIWLPERLQEQEALRLRDVVINSDPLTQKAFATFYIDRNVENYFTLMNLVCGGAVKVEEVRDINIAQQFELAEERIRSRYPALRDKTPLTYVTHFGAAHFPEESSKVSATVQVLTDYESPYLIFRKEGASDRWKQTVLASCLDSIFRGRSGLTREVLKKKPLHELITLAKTF